MENIHTFRDLLNQESLYWFCALSGSGMFLIQFLMSLLGSADSDQLEAGNFDTVRVNWLSKQAISGFLMMFGWTSLTCYNQFNLSGAMTLAVATTAGIFTVLVTGLLFKMTKKLHSSGTLFSLEDAIGKEAIVYQRIPRGGAGKISISLHHLTHEIDAFSLNDEEIPSFAPVKVIRKASDNVVIVASIKQ